jgi:putative transcriptional regulator
MRENAGMNARLCAALLTVTCAASAQSKRPEDLATGKILVTTRSAGDPLFAKSVVLLVRYDQSGALGLMINHRSTLPISRALKDLDGAASRSDPVFVGGPVELDTVFALARGRRKPQGGDEVLGDIYLLTEKSALQKALGASSGPSGLRVYLGYCGWTRGQLENEARLGLWYIFTGREDLAFDEQPPTLWSRLIEEAEALKADLVNRHTPGEQ